MLSLIPINQIGCELLISAQPASISSHQCRVRGMPRTSDIIKCMNHLLAYFSKAAALFNERLFAFPSSSDR